MTVTDEAKAAVSAWGKVLTDARLWWGFLAGLVGGVLYMISASADWGREQERAAIQASEHARLLGQHETRLNTAEDRIRALAVGVDQFRERMVYLGARREEDDKATQAQAVRDAEFRARLQNQLDNLQAELARLGRDVAPYVPRREGGPRLQDLPWRLHPLPQIEEVVGHGRP